MLVTNEKASVYGIASQTRTSTAQRWIAALLSFLLPGLGHLYRGALGRAIAVFLIIDCGFLALIVLLHVTTLHGHSEFLFLIPLECLRIAAAWDAYHFAGRLASTSTARSRRNLHIGVTVLWMIVVQLIMRRAARPLWFQLFHVPSGSMAPLMLAGEYILSEPSPAKVARGDVVVYYDGESGSNVKRVVGAGGDTLSMAGGKLFLNGHPIAEPYATRATPDLTDSSFAWQRRYVIAAVDLNLYKPSLDNWGPVLVPDSEYFVLGDDRHHSFDSRYTGFVSQRDLRALPMVIYLSIDGKSHRVRWSRIGKVIQ